MLGFFGFLRGREFTLPRDSAFNSLCHLTSQGTVDCHNHPTLVRVHTKQSKTDPFRHRVHILLGWSGSDLCLVSALLAYMAGRGIWTTSHCSDLWMADLLPDTDWFTTCARCYLMWVLTQQTTNHLGHSFRIGVTMMAAALGIEDSLIKTLGRWESVAYQHYMKLPRKRLAAISVTHGRSPKDPHRAQSSVLSFPFIRYILNIHHASTCLLDSVP